MNEESISGVVPIRNVGKSQTGTSDRRAPQIEVVDSPGVGAVVIEVVEVRGSWDVNVWSCVAGRLEPTTGRAGAEEIS